MDTKDDDNSSEGIVASSDDEFDGLSKAVEHHIIKQETATRRSNDTDWRDVYGQPQPYHEEQPRYDQDLRARPFIGRQHPPQYPRRHYLSTYHPGQQKEVMTKMHPHFIDLDYRNDMPLQPRRYSPPHRDRFSPPRKMDYMLHGAESSPQTYRDSRSTPLPRQLADPAYIRQPMSMHLATRPIRPLDHHSLSPPRPGILIPPGPSSHPLQPHNPAFHRKYHHSDRPREWHDDEEPSRSLIPRVEFSPPRRSEQHALSNLENDSLQADRYMRKPLIKPVSFKIKSVPPPELPKRHRHPLDPLNDSSVKAAGSDSPLSKWAHDKYEELCALVNKEETRTHSRSSKSPRRKRSSSARSSSPRRKQENYESGEAKKPRIERVYSGDENVQLQENKQDVAEKLEQDSSQLDSADDHIRRNEREDETVYEEEEVIVFDEADEVVASDDDEELLGLRLQALTSALHMENRSKESKPKPSKKTPRYKKPTRLIRRVHSHSPKPKRKSNVTDVFLKRYHSISRRRSPEKPRRPEKPTKSQLTLVGEIIKNHQPQTKDTLRRIRSQPDEEKKTEMFLKFMRQQGHAETTELYKEIFFQKNDGKVAAKTDANDDNYDEIEMDLEDEDSDSELVPPGEAPVVLPVSSSSTCPSPIVSPICIPSISSPYSPTKGIKSAEKTHSSTLRTIPGTPSQESIWSMLEKPVETDDTKNVAVTRPDINEEKRPRIPSDEADFDDDALLKLRATLLSQIDKQKDTKKIMEIELDDGPPGVSKEEIAALPSQFPYQPPTLRRMRMPSSEAEAVIDVPASISNDASNVKLEDPIDGDKLASTTASTSSINDKPVAEDAPSVVCAVQANEPINSLETVAVTKSAPDALTAIVSAKAEMCESVSPKQKSVIRRYELRSNTASISKTTVLEPATPVDSIATGFSSNKLDNFKPQMASTPALATETPLVSQSNKRTRRRKQSKSDEIKQPDVVDSLCESGSNVPNIPGGEELSGPTTPLTAVAAKILQKRLKRRRARERKKQLKQATKNMCVSQQMNASLSDANVQNIPNTLKALSTVKTSNSKSQTIVKTATTLIKSNPKSQTKKVTGAVIASQKSLPVTIDSKPIAMVLPRHQPVVINIGGSSDEEESILSSGKEKITAQNPLDLHKNMLDAMIKQVREQTTTSQKEKKTVRPFSKTMPQNPSLKSGTQAKAQSLKYTENLSSESASDVERIFKDPKYEASSKSTDVNRKTDSGSVKSSKTESNSSHKHHTPAKQSLSADLEALKSKFFKIRSLINKDKASHTHALKIRDSKIAELQTVEDELKEMMYRVAAIKGKKTRCEELVKRYSEQETKIKDRLDKRSQLKTKLEGELKKKYLQISVMKNAGKKTSSTIANATKDSKNEIVTKANSSSDVKKQDRLNKEKQRLLAMEQQLAEKINKMKTTEGTAPSASGARHQRKASLSKEVQSHLAKYRKTRKSSNPSAHDLSLSKIAIPALSPVRRPDQNKGVAVEENSSAVKNIMKSPAKATEPAAENADKLKSPDNIQTDGKATKTAKISTEDPVESEATKNLRKLLVKRMGDMKQFISLSQEMFFDIPFSSKAWEKSTPDCFKKWRLDTGETPVSKSDERNVKSVEFQAYRSPLRLFRCYRLNPFLRTKEKFAVKSKTFSHKINPRQIFCRYDITGSCQDPGCKGQHAKQYELSSTELIFDLMSYSPTLFKSGWKQNAKYEDLIKITTSVSNKLCGITSTKTAMSIDEKCVLIASKVNSALGNKPPFTTIFKPRTLKPQHQGTESWQFSPVQDTEFYDDTEKISDLDAVSSSLPDGAVEPDERYFPGKNPSDLRELDRAVQENPHDIQLWLELAYGKLRKSSTSEQNRLELALHTMCLALEQNPYAGELWSHYLGLLHHRKSAESDDDLHEMIAQAIELVPLSTHIWNQLLSWESNTLKREFLYDQLISNLVKCLEESTGHEDLPRSVMSHWLLQTILQRTHLLLLRNTTANVLKSLETMAQNLSQQCKYATMSKRCLTAKDLNSLWIAVLNIKHFRELPSCFLPCSRPGANVSTSLGVKIVDNITPHLDFDAEIVSVNAKYYALRADINDAIQQCMQSDSKCHADAILLLNQRLILERARKQWDGVITTCKCLCNTLSSLPASSESLIGFSFHKLDLLFTDATTQWVDAHVRDGDCLEAIKVFDDAVTKNPSNLRLSYEAALFQLNMDAVDVDAALLYFEIALSAFITLEKSNLGLKELRTLFRYLLKLETPLNAQSPSFCDGVTWENVNGKKAYLWLIYCRILELSDKSSETIMNCYEKAIDDVSENNDREEIWLRYLKYKQSLGSSIIDTGSQLAKARQSWFKNFTAIVRRCILTMSPLIQPVDYLSRYEDKYCDFTFHNQVASIYLSCLNTRQQLMTAYNFLTELMPYNVPLLLKACQYFLTFTDYNSIISTLWKITSNTLCQSKAVWKMSVSSHFARGRIAKAIHLSKRAVKAMPYSVELWSDYLALLKAYGSPEDFSSEGDRCSSRLQMDATLLLPET